MGAKQSAGGKKEADEVVTIKTRRNHQYEEIDEDMIIENQERLKCISLDSKEVPDGQTSQEAPTNGQSDTSNGAQTGNSLNSSASSTAALGQATPTDSPQVKKRYHPYDEIPDYKFSSNPKVVVDGNKDVKEKIKDKETFLGKKKKERKKDREEPELVTYQNVSEVLSQQTALSDQPEENSFNNSKDSITNHHSASSKDAKKSDGEGKSKKKDVMKKKKGKKKQEVTSPVDEKTVNEKSPIEISTGAGPRAGPQYPRYVEITEEQLTSNRDAHKLKKDEKHKNKANAKDKDKKKNQKATTESETRTTFVAGSKLTTGAESPNSHFEITEGAVAENSRATSARVGDGWAGRCTEQEGSNIRADVTVDSEPAEYLNAAAITASSLGSDVGHKEEDNVHDVYAVPQKKPPKISSPKTLNYIEVEFNPNTSRTEVKQPSSPTNYCTVMTKDGKVVLMES